MMMPKHIAVLLLICSLGLNFYLGSRLQTQNQTSNLVQTLKVRAAATKDAELNFLMDFTDKWFQFRSESFEASQLALTSWMSPALQASRQQEILRISEKMKDQQVEQTDQILRINETSENQFEIFHSVELIESGHPTQFHLQTTAQVENSEMTSQNIWGYQVKHFESSVTDLKPLEQNRKTLNLRANAMTKIRLPCSVQQTSEIDESQIQLKVLSARASEVHLLAKQSSTSPLTLSVQCEGVQFHWILTSNSFPVTRYLRVSTEEGEAMAPKATLIVQESSPKKKISKELKQSLKQLGIEPEESGPSK